MFFKLTISRCFSSLKPRTFSVTNHIRSPLIRSRNYSSTIDHLSKDQVQDRVFNVLKAFDKVVSTNPAFKATSAFTSDLGLDSLDVVEVVMAVEEEFGIEIPDEAADNFKTPQEVIEYVHAKMHNEH